MLLNVLLLYDSYLIINFASAMCFKSTVMVRSSVADETILLKYCYTTEMHVVGNVM